MDRTALVAFWKRKKAEWIANQVFEEIYPKFFVTAQGDVELVSPIDYSRHIQAAEDAIQELSREP